MTELDLLSLLIGIALGAAFTFLMMAIMAMGSEADDQSGRMFNEQIIKDAERYKYIKDNYEWRRVPHRIGDAEEHSMIGIRCAYDDNFECAAMIDHVIDQKIAEADFQKAVQSFPSEFEMRREQRN